MCVQRWGDTDVDIAINVKFVAHDVNTGTAGSTLEHTFSYTLVKSALVAEHVLPLHLDDLKPSHVGTCAPMTHTYHPHPTPHTNVRGSGLLRLAMLS